MEKLMNRARHALGQGTLLNDERGLTTVEYVIILMVIAVVSIGLWQSFGKAVTDKVTNATGAINDLPAASASPGP